MWFISLLTIKIEEIYPQEDDENIVGDGKNTNDGIDNRVGDDHHSFLDLSYGHYGY